MARIGSAIVAGVVLGVVAVSPARATSPPDPVVEDNDHLFTVGSVTVPPGDPDKVDVVLTGPSDRSSVPMIVRNNTDAAVVGVEVSGIARDAEGQLVATGASQGFEPHLLEAGEWAIGYVYFEFDVLSGSETFEFAATARPDDGSSSRVPLAITEAVFHEDEFADRVVGIVTNGEQVQSFGPNSVYVACFDGPSLVGVASGFTDVDEVQPGGIAPFTVDLYDIESCPSMALASSGWDF